MNRKFFLLGVVTIGLLLLGSLPASVAQEEPEMDPFGDMEGTVDISYDISLTNVWDVGPTPQSITGDLTNTNLRYNLTSMKSPLDAFFNVGAFVFGDSDSGPQPEFMIDGTFEGSELFVKIIKHHSDNVFYCCFSTYSVSIREKIAFKSNPIGLVF